ncbi:uncharacterized protein SCHCODRAFT_02535485 [Schizophyllum commune H4-8]|uniref:Uncharacterized protein n=1 Tax=Schizophyllum commune (strain H4-8 / FGSC 9210) TaxID=578458 RepID=D8Q0G9_SCHCM|nr:uncharacterized protein SCHCODRAFT_02535485 [Schizophyllum commune H4-8]KAI5895011.1 hypothetical protein SCHCODRAFT_02535485 [Schizophyllum commune H4-8]
MADVDLIDSSDEHSDIDDRDEEEDDGPVIDWVAQRQLENVVRALLRSVAKRGLHGEAAVRGLLNDISASEIRSIALRLRHYYDSPASLLHAGMSAILQAALDIRSPDIIQLLLEHRTPTSKLLYSPSDIDWARGQPCYRGLVAGLTDRYALSNNDLKDVFAVLSRLGLGEVGIVLDILDLAQFWYCTSAERADYVKVRKDDQLVYLALQVPNTPVRAVTFITESRDQGWSSFPRRYGTYRRCRSWFEAGIEGSDARLFVQANIHASPHCQRHVTTFDLAAPKTQRWMSSLQPGKELQLIARAVEYGWENNVYEAEIRIYSQLTLGKLDEI